MSELTLKQACAETQKFGRMLKGMERLVDVANALESADQAVSDRRREEAELLAKITNAREELEAIARSIATARESSQQVGIDAQATAATIVSDARAQAEKIVADARTEEAAARENSKSVIARAQAAERRLASAQAELAGVEARLEQAKAEGRKRFEG